MSFNPSIARSDFPIFKQALNGKRLSYLDTASTAQKPTAVLTAMTHFYEQSCANVHRGVYALSEQATAAYEQARRKVQKFIGAKSAEEIVFTKGTTESLNLLAHSFPQVFCQAGDEILISQMEHHANIVSWQLVEKRYGIKLKVIPLTPEGDLDLAAFKKLLNPRTKLVSLIWVSNVLGTVNPVAEIIDLAHEAGVPVCLDAAQTVLHQSIDVQALNVDFLVFSGHKLYGPTGVGVLYARKFYLEQLPPYQGGGDMIHTVSFEGSTFAPPPGRFEAGTPNIAGVIGLGAALDYLNSLDLIAVHAHEAQLLSYALDELSQIPSLRIIGKPRERQGLFSFVLETVHPHDVASILDQEGVALRAGHHCAMPLIRYCGVPATLRLSLGLYNTREDIDHCVHALKRVLEIFK